VQKITPGRPAGLAANGETFLFASKELSGSRNVDAIDLRAPRKIGATHPTPQKCRQMIPLRSRSDSWTFTLEPHAIRIESNFSRCP
jgi:hypothetical protein